MTYSEIQAIVRETIREQLEISIKSNGPMIEVILKLDGEEIDSDYLWIDDLKLRVTT